jgi:hypothetical protein
MSHRRPPMAKYAEMDMGSAAVRILQSRRSKIPGNATARRDTSIACSASLNMIRGTGESGRFLWRRSGARNAQLHSRHRYFLFETNKSTNHSRPVASRNLSVCEPHFGHRINTT